MTHQDAWLTYLPAKGQTRSRWATVRRVLWAMDLTALACAIGAYW
jgi:hypothetical protein